MGWWACLRECISICTYKSGVCIVYVYNHTSKHLHVCVHVFICIYSYIYTYICVCIYIYTYNINIFIYIHMYLFFTYKCRFIYIYICVYHYTHRYVHAQTRAPKSCKYTSRKCYEYNYWGYLEPSVHWLYFVALHVGTLGRACPSAVQQMAPPQKHRRDLPEVKEKSASHKD